MMPIKKCSSYQYSYSSAFILLQRLTATTYLEETETLGPMVILQPCIPSSEKC